jgi:hypothetical protein
LHPSSYWVGTAFFLLASLAKRDLIRAALFGWITLFLAALSRADAVCFNNASSGEASVFLISVLIQDLSCLFLTFALCEVFSLFSADLWVGKFFLLS